MNPDDGAYRRHSRLHLTAAEEEVPTPSSPNYSLKVSFDSRVTRRWYRRAVWLLILCTFAGLVFVEARTMWLQSQMFAAIARRLNFAVSSTGFVLAETGNGPYDQRLGYARIPEVTEKLARAGYTVESRARVSEWMKRITDRGLPPIYAEKTQAGLKILDRRGLPLFDARYPRRVYPNFEAIPPLVVGSLLYVENREILDENTPYRNPAVEWGRLGKAVIDLGRKKLDASATGSGGSTLATQLEKVRHSPDGRTGKATEKLRQMISASLRAYLRGEETLGTRRQITADYINSLPLASLAGYGEVHGLGDGLWAWFEADFDAVNRLAWSAGGKETGITAEEALACRQLLSLLLAVNRPTYFLQRDRAALQARGDHFLRLMADSGMISPALRDAVLAAKLRFREQMPDMTYGSFADRKGVDSIRNNLLGLVGLDSLYEVDRWDLTVQASLDRQSTEGATRVLKQLNDKEFATEAGLVGKQLLNAEGVDNVIYSFTLYETGEGVNLMRVQADSYDQPLNINQGTRLELGSTAKLRTLATYLEIMAELHEQMQGKTAAELRDLAADSPEDKLRQWAAEYLAENTDPTLPGILEAAMARKYSASPNERFFTGGGVHTFSNFDPKDDGQIFTVREGLHRSSNLLFIRLMRDIVHHFYFKRPGVTKNILRDEGDPMRQEYLRRFADREGREYLAKFYNRYKGLDAEAMLEKLTRRVRPTPVRLSVAYRSARPEDELDVFEEFLEDQLGVKAPTPGKIAELYNKYGAGKFNLQDRGYLARLHPLELWLVQYLHDHPGAKWDEIVEASTQERQEIYRWLLTGRKKRAQDLRLHMMIEVDAFAEMQKVWKRHGYPFGNLVPSYATAIGSSGDNPAALAELAGIILNGGARYPAIRVEKLHFAEGTPMETLLGNRPAEADRAMPAAVAAVLKEAMRGVVEFGTARRAFNSVKLKDGTILRVGAKTGTGDNRFETHASAGGPAQSKVVNRTAAFVFTIGDHYYGTIIAYAPGEGAAAHHFTSALPVSIFKTLVPTILPLLEKE